MIHHPRLPDLEGLLDKEGRDEFLSSAVRLGISIQTQVLRGHRSQKEFADATGKTQTQVWRLENAKSGGVSLQTLIDMACALNIGLSVRFVDFDRMLDEINDMSDDALRAKTIFESVEKARQTVFPNSALPGDRARRRRSTRNKVTLHDALQFTKHDAHANTTTDATSTSRRVIELDMAAD